MNGKVRKHEKNQGFIKQGYLWIKSHRPLFYSIIAVILIIIALFGAKIYLYLNFLLGNDVIIKFSTDSQDFKMHRGETEILEFEAKVTTNPFCKAICTTSFEDISSANTLNRENFTLKPGNPIRLNYTISVNEFGEGQKIYRANMECYAKNTAFCHTSEQKTYRNTLITVEYSLSESEKRLKESAKQDIQELKDNLAISELRINATKQMIDSLKKELILTDMENKNSRDKRALDSLNNEMMILTGIWNIEDYEALSERLTQDMESFTAFFDDTSMNFEESKRTIDRYNSAVEKMNSSKTLIESMKSIETENQDILMEIEDLIALYNLAVQDFTSRNTLVEKENNANNILITLNNKRNILLGLSHEETLKKAIQFDIEYDVLCSLEQACEPHNNISVRAESEGLSLSDECNNVIKINNIYNTLQVNTSGSDGNSNDTKKDPKVALAELRQYIAEDYLSRLPDNKTNTELLMRIISGLSYSGTSNPVEKNLIPDMIRELAGQKLSECRIMKSETNLTGFSPEIKKTPDMPPANITFFLAEPTLKCCVFGKCSECCTTDECRNSEENYPIIFIHGHAFSKGIEADYSLDAFNKIQEKLESDGYLNAGAISLYTKQEEAGVWGLSDTHLSIKATYYQDIFQEPQNYVVVQTKSENIDTYAIRLKEIISTIEYKTGRPKVIIIAHSMGGLVTRRYIQLFGTGDIDKIIMIGTPNRGIVGKTASYCTLTGASLECRDLNADSLFMNKVNRERIPSAIESYNFIGVGCDMDGFDGDGVVVSSYASLNESKNIYINGTCQGMDTLHIDMLDIDKYPEVYDNIKRIIKS